MKKLILFFFITFLSTTSFAKRFTCENIRMPIDDNFFQTCLDNLVSYPNMKDTYKCTVFEAKEGTKILRNSSFLMSLNYITTWSETRCSLEGGFSRLYMNVDKKKVQLFVGDQECLGIMSDAVAQIDNFKKQSLNVCEDIGQSF